MKILLAEDSRFIAAAMKSRLTSLGYIVDIAENGQVAFDTFCSSQYDLVLMDIEMPVMNGFEATTLIRTFEATQKWAWTPIIFLTASDTPENLVTAIEAGGDDFMVKNMPEPVLHAKMKAQTRITAMRQQLARANDELDGACKSAETSRLHAESAQQLATRALDDLVAAQTQVIQSEKMAALGQLIAGIAHEINTPIGAIKSSGKNIIDALTHVFGTLPRLFQVLDVDTERLFMQLIDHVGKPMELLSSREERTLAREVGRQLEEADIADARQKAGLLVQLRANTRLDDFLPLLRHVECNNMLDAAYSVSTIVGNTANINTAVERVAKIIFALKSFSRFNTSGESEMIETDLREGLETVLTIYNNQIKQNTELVRNYEDIAPIPCLPDELNQVWTNLIHNALQAMKHSGTLTIGVRRENDEAIVSVGDSGCGIPEEIRSRIFDPFFTTKPIGEGSGLGLDIVKKIIAKHNGRIELQSEVGRGTTFSVHLPYSVKAS